jgi:cation transport ATPase
LTDDQDDPPKDRLEPSYRTALAVTAVSIMHAVIIAILSFYFVYARPSHAQAWANFLGIFSTVLASIQYFPQIYTTYMLKRVGSLSIPMMLIQTPGSFVWAASLAARLGSEGWSAWGVYLVTGCLQGTLLAMGSYFEIMHRRREKEELQARMSQSQPETPYATEETPLLRSED